MVTIIWRSCLTTNIQLAAFIFFVLIAPLYVYAATIFVNTIDDELNTDSDCSLREAIRSANLDAAVDACSAGNGADEINFASSVIPGIFTLTIAGSGEDSAASGDLDITDDLTITGAGVDITIIDGSESDRVFDIAPSGNDIAVTITDVTITGGDSPVSYSGGGIRNGGLLTLHYSAVSNNGNSFNTFEGGGIFNTGTLILIDSTVSSNLSLEQGGGIFNTGTLILIDSTVSSSSLGEGGGIFNNSGTVALIDSIVRDSVSGNGLGSGGGIFNRGGMMTLTNSTVRDNIAREFGGGIFNDGGMVTLHNSTVSNNELGDSSAGGGGIFNSGTLTLTNSTVNGNDAVNIEGGGIFNSGTLTLTNSTVSGNDAGSSQGGGIFNDGGTVTLQNTILAENTASRGVDCFGEVTSLNNNLIGKPTDCSIALLAGDLTGDPGLNVFTDDGMPGHGHFPLLATSQAIDAANNEVCLAIDQLGNPRPVDGDDDGTAICDIGAVEVSSQPLLVKPVISSAGESCSLGSSPRCSLSISHSPDYSDDH